MKEEINDTPPIAETSADTRATSAPGASADANGNTRVPAEEEGPPPTTEDPNLQPTEAEPAKSGKGEPIITIKGVFKSFKDHDVLRGVDMYVYKGENLVILGKSGSGKS